MIQDIDYPWDANRSTANGCYVRTLETSDARHTVRQVSSRTWLLSLHTCSTTHSCQSEPRDVIVVLRAVPVLSQDAQHIRCVPVLILQPHQMHVCHTLRRCIVAHCISRPADAPESVLHVSIAHLSRPIFEAVRPHQAIALLLSLGG